MKRAIVYSLLLIGLLFCMAMTIEPKPQFKFVEEIHDFGKITQGKPVTVEMKFTNVGDEPIIISAVEPTCGCTVAKYTSTPVLKGKTGSVTLTYNAAVVGQFTKPTTIKSNALGGAKTIYIKGEVIAAPTAVGK